MVAVCPSGPVRAIHFTSRLRRLHRVCPVSRVCRVCPIAAGRFFQRFVEIPRNRVHRLILASDWLAPQACRSSPRRPRPHATLGRRRQRGQRVRTKRECAVCECAIRDCSVCEPCRQPVGASDDERRRGGGEHTRWIID